uniref:Uncharacterized protein n=1 Tax=Oryza brachyantha TaxID=4533 RepID=J3LWI0_ORYBR
MFVPGSPNRRLPRFLSEYGNGSYGLPLLSRVCGAFKTAKPTQISHKALQPKLSSTNPIPRRTISPSKRLKSVIVDWLRRTPQQRSSSDSTEQNIKGSWSPTRSRARLGTTRASPPRLERRRKGNMAANGTQAGFSKAVPPSGSRRERRHRLPE